ncbi:protein disulfide isomerase-related protein [Aureococcus anophagefferens]|nr:protein disulfide isomerase-related protein [Aureococcus anophagefferens]
MRRAVALLGVAALARAAFYPADGPVATLDPYNFDAFVEAAPLTIVEFYAPWCGHCQQVAPGYLAAAAALSEKHGGRVAFGAMDESDEDNRRLRAGSEDMYDFKHYPALVVFYGREGGLSIGRQLLASDGLHGPKKDALGHTWDRYYGGTERAELEFWVEALLDGKNPIVEERTVLKPGLYRDDARNDGLVEELDAEGLASIAKGARDVNAVWVVEFYSDRCPHCKTLVPEMISAAEKLRKSLGRTQVRVAAINARVFFEASEEHGVAGLPWVTGWYDGQRLEDMAGLSDAQSVVRWGTRMHQTKWKRKAGDAPEDDDVPDDGLTPTCRNADICTCSNDPPTCRCAPSAYSRGCCNMNCGDCGDLCAALSGKKKKKPKAPPVVEKKDAAKKEPPVVEKWPGTWEKKDAVAVDAAGGAAAAPAANGTAWREALGAHTWFYLHTFAAKYPDAPTEADKVAARWQLDAIYLKDCGDCKAGSAFSSGGKGEAAGERPFFAAAYAADPALYVGAYGSTGRALAASPKMEVWSEKNIRFSSSPHRPPHRRHRHAPDNVLFAATLPVAIAGVWIFIFLDLLKAAIPGDEDFDFGV